MSEDTQIAYITVFHITNYLQSQTGSDGHVNNFDLNEGAFSQNSNNMRALFIWKDGEKSLALPSTTIGNHRPVLL